MICWPVLNLMAYHGDELDTLGVMLKAVSLSILAEMLSGRLACFCNVKVEQYLVDFILGTEKLSGTVHRSNIRKVTRTYSWYMY